MAGTALYGAMLVLGIVTSVAVDYDQFATPQSDPSFFSIQLADMLAFAVLGGAAIALRKSADAHKRRLDPGYAAAWVGIGAASTHGSRECWAKTLRAESERGIRAL